MLCSKFAKRIKLRSLLYAVYMIEFNIFCGNTKLTMPVMVAVVWKLVLCYISPQEK